MTQGSIVQRGDMILERKLSEEQAPKMKEVLEKNPMIDKGAQCSELSVKRITSCTIKIIRGT